MLMPLRRALAFMLWVLASFSKIVRRVGSARALNISFSIMQTHKHGLMCLGKANYSERVWAFLAPDTKGTKLADYNRGCALFSLPGGDSGRCGLEQCFERCHAVTVNPHQQATAEQDAIDGKRGEAGSFEPVHQDGNRDQGGQE